jgi:hypothetical protein
MASAWQFLNVHGNNVGKVRWGTILGIAGALTIVGGVAAPLLSVPIAGAVSFLHEPARFQGAAHVGAIILLAAAALGILAALMRWRLLLAAAGVASLGELAAMILDIHHAIATAEAQAKSTPIADPFVLWRSAMLHKVHYEWGVAVIVAGGLMLLVAAALRD